MLSLATAVAVAFGGELQNSDLRHPFVDPLGGAFDLLSHMLLSVAAGGLDSTLKLSLVIRVEQIEGHDFLLSNRIGSLC
ncbi:MAG: hypothetical protein A3C58_00790 [Candidatus Staskawiczbacteria bacterium RIFCSPHIGHO2_02_FULL_34_10]|uniref:Uncharacterized protein n=1 Tax=Candidatus Staskawiczbacteria bacterium RIFCSPHIGHO2_02_FULL_34_10 TaxID=1802205 RepID=A0A1G2HWP4_9BACT|nr:MAG: hypothetical protein A3C58_00790 [Candidatus Staskawiczbacteria bacterium RIFCSPHIGHO2_02_FULL_34_10]